MELQSLDNVFSLDLCCQEMQNNGKVKTNSSWITNEVSIRLCSNGWIWIKYLRTLDY